jgi:hypothetical protein
MSWVDSHQASEAAAIEAERAFREGNSRQVRSEKLSLPKSMHPPLSRCAGHPSRAFISRPSSAILAGFIRFCASTNS